METNQFMHIVHIIALITMCLVLIARAKPLLINTQQIESNFNSKKSLVGLQHAALTVVVLTGIVLLYQKQFQMQPWFYAKIILFLVMLSAFAKAFKKDSSVLLIQRRAGLMIGSIAFVSILGLVWLKPVFG